MTAQGRSNEPAFRSLDPVVDTLTPKRAPMRSRGGVDTLQTPSKDQDSYKMNIKSNESHRKITKTIRKRRTDGTETGTEMVVDLAAGANSSDPMPLYYNNENIEEFTHAGNGIVYFWADAEADGTYELYRSDGTPSGTSQIGTVIWE